MANGRYYGGSSPVANQLNFLANTLRGGMQDIGAAELANARLAHEVGDPRNVLARRKASDELAAAEDYENFLNQPLELEDFTGPNPGPLRREFIASHYLPEMEKYGLSAKGGRFWGKDAARPLTKRDYYSRHNLSKLIMAGVFDQRRGMENSASRARVAGDTAGAKRWEAEIKKYDADPRPYLRKKRNFLAGLQLKVRPELQKNVQGYIDAVDKQIAAWKLKPVKEKDKTTLGKLIAERDALPKDDPRRGIYDSRIRKLTDPKEAKKDAEPDRKLNIKDFRALSFYLFNPEDRIADKEITPGHFAAIKTEADSIGVELQYEVNDDGDMFIVTGVSQPEDISTEEGGTVSPGVTTPRGIRPDFIYTKEGGFQRP